MKQRIFASLVLAMLTLLASCEQETVLIIDQTDLSFSDTGSTQTITLISNKPWTAGSSQSWCKVSPTGGEAASGNRITISCDANTTYDARNCSVTITCAELMKTISISQATNNGLLVAQTSYELTKEAQQLNIQVQANVKFKVEVDNGCKDWVKYSTTKGLTTSAVVLDIAENATYDDREGKVIIKQEGGNLSSTIIIKQSQLDGLFVTTSEYNLSNDKHTLTVEVNANVEFDVKPNVDWIRHVETKGLKSSQIVLEVSANKDFDKREGTVTVKQINGENEGTITIHQEENYGLFISPNDFSLNNSEQLIDVEVKYNVEYEVVIPNDCKEWISLVSTKGLSSKYYSFSIAKNETYDNRDGSITFKQKNGALSGTIVIRQSQTDGLIADKREYVIPSESRVLDIQVRSNINYDVIIDETCRDWISRISTKGLVEETLSFQIANNENEQRKGKIYLRSSSIEEEIVVIQEAEGYVEFDDENFEVFCLKYYDKNEDGRISFSEAARVESVWCSDCKIKSLKGIEHFINISYLTCSNNRLTSLDVSNCAALQELDCNNNRLTSLNVSNCTILKHLSCCDNQLTNLDISNNTSLRDLQFDNNRLTSIDVSNCIAIEGLSCFNNLLTSLDVSNCTSMLGLNCDNNQITSLNVSNCSTLVELRCDNNRLTSLDVSNFKDLEVLYCTNNLLSSLSVSNCTNLLRLNCGINQIAGLDVSMCTSLKELMCYSNQLTSLDVSKCTFLWELNCDNNQLTNLDVSENLILSSLWCIVNPYLTEIWLKTNQTINEFHYDVDVAIIKYK